MNLFDKNVWISIKFSLNFIPRGLKDNKSIPVFTIGSGNGLEPNKQQAITWANDDPVHFNTLMSPGLFNPWVGLKSSTILNSIEIQICFHVSLKWSSLQSVILFHFF